MQFNSLYKVLRKRDFIVLGLIIIALYLSLEGADFTYTLEPAWYIARGTSSTKWNAIPPVVTDINGDGKRDIIVVTNDLHLKVLSGERKSKSDGIYSPVELHSKALSHSIAETGKWPVAMKVGYIDPYSSIYARTQVVIVVLEDWTVLCFDSQLNILWEKEVGHFSMNLAAWSKQYKIDQISVHISPIDIISDPYNHEAGGDSAAGGGETKEENNFGLVVIGASMSVRGNVSDHNRHEHDHIHVEHGMLLNEDGDVEHGDMNQQKQLEHFSMFALSGRTGKIIWKHDGTDIASEQFTKSIPQHSLLTSDRLTYETRKDLILQSHHTTKNNDWTAYKTSLLEQLPHDWHHREDTGVSLQYFRRGNVGTGSDSHAQSGRGGVGSTDAGNVAKSKLPLHKLSTSTGILGKGRSHKLPSTTSYSSTTSGGKAGSGGGKSGVRRMQSKQQMIKHAHQRTFENWFSGIRMPNVPVTGHGDSHESSAILPHDSSEHVEHPNVVVAHTKNGLDIVSLSHGQPITALSLTEGFTYTDLNGDGVVDSIVLLEDERSVATHGHAFAHGGGEWMPCTMMVLSGLPAKAQLFNASICLTHGSLHEPLSLQHRTDRRHNSRVSSVKAAPPLVMRKMSVRQPNIEDKVKDVVIAVNTGIVSSYTGSGGNNWQVRGAPAWLMNFDFASVLNYDFDYDRLVEQFRGHADHPFSLILVMGQYAVHVYNREGQLLTASDIPKFPVLKPLLSDFDNDGITDVIITTENAILGYKMRIQVATSMMFIGVCILAVVALLSFFTNIKSEVVLPPVQQQRVNVNTNARRMYSLRRSTDDTHAD